MSEPKISLFDPDQTLWIVVPIGWDSISVVKDEENPLWLAGDKSFGRARIGLRPPTGYPAMGECLLALKGLEVDLEQVGPEGVAAALRHGRAGEFAFERDPTGMTWGQAARIFQFPIHETLELHTEVKGLPKIFGSRTEVVKKKGWRMYRTSSKTEVLTSCPEWPMAWPAARLVFNGPEDQIEEVSLAPGETEAPVVETKKETPRQAPTYDPTAWLERAVARLLERQAQGVSLPSSLEVAGKGTVGLGKILRNSRCPLELWKYAFSDAFQAEVQRSYWGHQSKTPRDSFWAAATMAKRDPDSSAWYERMKWNFSLGAKPRLDSGHANCLHLLAVAKDANFNHRTKIIEKMCRSHRAGTIDGKRPSKGTSFDPLMSVDAAQGTPLMRALRVGDAKMAMWLLEKKPEAVAVSDSVGSFALAVVRHLQVDEGMKILEKAMEMAPKCIQKEDLQAAWLLAADVSETAKWRSRIEEWTAPPSSKESMEKEKKTELSKEYGVPLDILRRRRRVGVGLEISGGEMEGGENGFKL